MGRVRRAVRVATRPAASWPEGQRNKGPLCLGVGRVSCKETPRDSREAGASRLALTASKS